MNDLLPDCMMPDGAEPCKGYQHASRTLTGIIRKLEAEVERLQTDFSSLQEIEAAQRIAKIPTLDIPPDYDEYEWCCKQWNVAPRQDDKIYPCDKCGVLRSKAEGGTIFTVCDACWDKHWHTAPRQDDEKK